MKKNIIHLVMVLLLAVPQGALSGDAMTQQQNLVHFSGPDQHRWYPVNDGVMGGLSASGLTFTDQGTGLFAGELSLENNGGFASVRTVIGPVDLSNHAGLEIKVRGDGRTYQLRLRLNDRFDGISYRAFFETQADQWTSIRVPFSEFQPTFRGRILDEAPALDTSAIQQLAFMLADKQPGPFALEIGSVMTWNSDKLGP